MRVKFKKMIKELKGIESFEKEMYLAQRRLDIYRQYLEKADMVTALRNGTGIITADEVQLLIAC